MSDDVRRRAEAALARAEKAANGPWVNNECTESGLIEVVNEKVIVAESIQYQDATFIAAARTDVPYLARELLKALDELHRVERDSNELRRQLKVALAEHNVVLRLACKQAEDPGLWFLATTASEAYLQQELRRLHAAIEGEP